MKPTMFKVPLNQYPTARPYKVFIQIQRSFQFNIKIFENHVVRLINATSLYQVSKLVTTRLMDNNMIEKPLAIEEGTRHFVTFINEGFLVYDLQNLCQFVRRNFLTCLLANDKANLQRRILVLQ